MRAVHPREEEVVQICLHLMMIKKEFDKVSFVAFKFSANSAPSLCLYWGTAAPIELPSSNTCTKAYFSLNLHVGCRCAPCAFMLRPGLKKQPLARMYGPGRGGKGKTPGKTTDGTKTSRSQHDVTSAYISLAKRCYRAKSGISGPRK